MSFEYTEATVPASSFVMELIYNENNGELAVVLDADREDVYVYPKVDRATFDEFSSTDSVGGYYQREFKKKFGPSNFIGSYRDVEFLWRPVNREVRTNVDMTVSPDRVGGRSRPEPYSKDNDYYKQGLVVTDGLSTTINTNVLTIHQAKAKVNEVEAPESIKYKHKVVFESDGKVREHTLTVGSVIEAVTAIEEIADMLDLTFKVKEVTVYFE